MQGRCRAGGSCVCTCAAASTTYTQGIIDSGLVRRWGGVLRTAGIGAKRQGVCSVVSSGAARECHAPSTREATRHGARKYRVRARRTGARGRPVVFHVAADVSMLSALLRSSVGPRWVGCSEPRCDRAKEAPRERPSRATHIRWDCPSVLINVTDEGLRTLYSLCAHHPPPPLLPQRDLRNKGRRCAPPSPISRSLDDEHPAKPQHLRDPSRAELPAVSVFGPSGPSGPQTMWSLTLIPAARERKHPASFIRDSAAYKTGVGVQTISLPRNLHEGFQVRTERCVSHTLPPITLATLARIQDSASMRPHPHPPVCGLALFRLSGCRHSSHRHPPLPNQPTPQTRRTTRSSVVAKAQNAVTGRTVSQSGIFPPSDAPRAVFPRWQDSVFERWDDCPSHSRALSQSRSSPLPRGAARNIPSLGIS